jgi:hypothetical protein
LQALSIQETKQRLKRVNLLEKQHIIESYTTRAEMVNSFRERQKSLAEEHRLNNFRANVAHTEMANDAERFAKEGFGSARAGIPKNKQPPLESYERFFDD